RSPMRIVPIEQQAPHAIAPRCGLLHKSLSARGRRGHGRFYALLMTFRFANRPMPLRDRLERRTGARPPEKPAPNDEGAAARAPAAQRGKGTIAPAPKAGKAAAALLRPIMPQGGMGLSELKRRWVDIVGASFADRAQPEKLAAGVLTLRAPGAIAPFLQQQ